MSIKYNERDGTHLLLTNRRHKMLIQQLKNKKVKTLDILDMKIEISKFIYKETSSKKNASIKIIIPQINDITTTVNINKIKLATLNKNHFYLKMEEFLQFNENVVYMIKKIEYLDFINSGAINSLTKGYTKPIIEKSSNSYFKAVN